jgi:ERF superfamily
MPDTAPKSLAEALIKLQASLPRITKTADGQYGKYADLAVIHAAVFPLLAACGLAWVCKPTLLDSGQFVLAYVLTHAASGETETGDYPLGTGTAQQMGSAITYARRYALCAVIGIVADADDDGTAAQDAAQWHAPASPHTRKASRSRGQLGDDEWTTEPAEGADIPGSITDAQGKRIHAWFTKLGITDRQDRLAYVMSKLNLPELASSKDLSMAQASELIRHLQEDGQ